MNRKILLIRACFISKAAFSQIEIHNFFTLPWQLYLLDELKGIFLNYQRFLRNTSDTSELKLKPKISKSNLKYFKDI